MSTAFPKASVRVVVSKEWTEDDIKSISVDSITDVKAPVEVMAKQKKVLLKAVSRPSCLALDIIEWNKWKDADIGRMSGLQRLKIFSTHSSPYEFPFTAFNVLVKLVDLSLTGFDPPSLTHASLLPLAGRLTRLSINRCPGVTDFSAFTQLRDLSYMTPQLLDPTTFPLQLHSVSIECPGLSTPWTSLAAMSQLREVRVEYYSGNANSGLHSLPPTVTKLCLQANRSIAWDIVTRLPSVKVLSLGEFTPHPANDEAELTRRRQQAATLAGLTSLAVNADYLLQYMPSMPQLKVLHIERGPVNLPWLLSRVPNLEQLKLGMYGTATVGDLVGCIESLPCLNLLQARLPNGSAASTLLASLYASLQGRLGATLRVWARIMYATYAYQDEAARKAAGIQLRSAEDKDCGLGWYVVTPARVASGILTPVATEPRPVLLTLKWAAAPL